MNPKKIGRQFMEHYIDAAMPGTVDTNYVPLGDDLEEYKVEMGAQVDKKKNIRGGNSVNVSGYEPTASVSPYYAAQGDPLFERLQDAVDNRRIMDDLKTTVLEVKLWTSSIGTEFEAYREEAIIEISNYGGPSTGYQYEFTLHHTGKRVKGMFDVATRKFTPDAPTQKNP